METPQPQAIRARTWVGVALTTVALLAMSCAGCGLVVWPYAEFLLFPGGFCSDEDARLLRRLAAEPLVTRAPPDFVELERYAFQPCEGDGGSSYHGAVGTRWVYGPTETTSVVHFYQGIALDGAWHIGTCRILLCAAKDIDGTNVSFRLDVRLDGAGRPGYVAEISYKELGR